MKNAQISLDPKDLLVILALVYVQCDDAWTYESMARLLGLSVSQVHGAVARLRASGLLVGPGFKGKVNREALAGFIIHGARFAWPPVFGGTARGLATGASSDLFDQDALQPSQEAALVWPFAQGDTRGQSLAPIHPSVPAASLREPSLRKALVHFDVLRTGRARERAMAEGFFRESLAWAS